MTRYSANLGFLWTELTLPRAIHAAARAGFAAVECHWPYATPAVAVARALAETGLPMLGLNTARGGPGEMGLSALPGREAEARAAIDQAVAYARAIGARHIHVMAGHASGAAARATFLANLRHALAAAPDLTLLIEPLNRHDAPGYFLTDTDQAREILAEIAASRLRLMFDCYHVQIAQGDVTRRLAALMPLIGHVQIASVPDRAEPDRGELDYAYILDVLADLRFDAPIGAEYRPATTTEAGLVWRDTLAARRR